MSDAEVFELVWPRGVPERDRFVFDALRPAEKPRVLDRLEAVHRAATGERLAPLAKLAGLGRAAFYNLREAWTREGLVGLVPGDTRAARRPEAPREDLRAAAAELLKADPGGRNIDIARKLVGAEKGRAGRPRKDAVDAPSARESLRELQRAERVVQFERRELARDPGFLAGAYARGLLVDLTAISAVLTTEPEELAVVAIVMESASGLVLGTAAGRLGGAAQLQRDALEDALRFLSDKSVDRKRAPGGRCDLAVVLPPDTDRGRLDRSTIAGAVRDLEIGGAGGYGFGQGVVQLVGPRIGRMVVNPRRTLAVDLDQFRRTRKAQEVGDDLLPAIWRREVARHNEDVMDALVRAGLVGDGGVPAGCMAAVIRTLLEALPR